MFLTMQIGLKPCIRAAYWVGFPLRSLLPRSAAGFAPRPSRKPQGVL